MPLPILCPGTKIMNKGTSRPIAIQQEDVTEPTVCADMPRRIVSNGIQARIRARRGRLSYDNMTGLTPAIFADIPRTIVSPWTHSCTTARLGRVSYDNRTRQNQPSTPSRRDRLSASGRNNGAWYAVAGCRAGSGGTRHLRGHPLTNHVLGGTIMD